MEDNISLKYAETIKRKKKTLNNASRDKAKKCFKEKKKLNFICL